MNIDFNKDEYKDLTPEAKNELNSISQLYQSVQNKLNTMHKSDSMNTAKDKLDESFDAVVESCTDLASQTAQPNQTNNTQQHQINNPTGKR